ncbi:MAG: hypothetical protein AUG51_24775 [Acidobacteria bacterium 13_1_20CM_3_53_8]|nr:MAG: hypothetical protein AUG51_24775 [Acidobacteria bacterium 13_1_20CM_3_53_8]
MRNRLRSPLSYTRLSSAIFTVLFLAIVAAAQSDVPRQTIAVTYPLDETVVVKFRGTTRLPRLSGTAKIRRAGRRGTRVELSVDNLPRASELGGVYTTYVLWAISPEGHIDNLGEIKRSGSNFIDSKLDVTTPLQTFALMVTAEPHFLVRSPSRMVVLENLPPQRPGDAQIATVNVQYLGNTSDYFNDPQIPEIADSDLRETPTSLLGARQAINLARYAGADRDAADELKEAQQQLEQAENAWRLHQPTPEIDALSRRATSLGAHAEEMAGTRKAARLRREDTERRDAAIRDAERSASSAEEQITQLRTALEREQRQRENAERDLGNANEQVRDLRSEIARMREELERVRAESEQAKLQLARIEGERAAEQARQNAVQRAQQQQASAANFRQSLSQFGNVRETSRGLVLVLPESFWANARKSDLTAAANAKLEPLAALLANNPDYQIVIESFTDNRGDQNELQKLTQDRAQAIAERLVSAGVDSGRIQATGQGGGNPLASNATLSGRQRNRRTEITFILQSQPSAATSAQP